LSGKFRRVRIALVTTSYPAFNGQAAGHFVAAEAEALSRAGHDVVVIAPDLPDCPCRGGLSLVGIAGLGLFGAPGALARLRQNPLRAAGGLWFVLRARRELARRGPFDRIIAHWLLPCGWPILSGFAGAREVVIHGSDLRTYRRLPGALRRHLISEWLRAGVSFRCVSEALRDALLEDAAPELEPHVSVEASPIDVALVATRTEAREQLALDADARLIVVVARLIPDKRVRLALEAVCDLPGVQICVVGGGPDERSLRRAFPAVHFTGELPRQRALLWIRAADVLVSASRLEGAPTSVREARALNVPVVACPAGDLASWAEQDPGLWLTC
jgi:teichuronic acid biosynthesis glycosyltransferase TuaC